MFSETCAMWSVHFIINGILLYDENGFMVSMVHVVFKHNRRALEFFFNIHYVCWYVNKSVKFRRQWKVEIHGYVE